MKVPFNINLSGKTAIAQPWHMDLPYAVLRLQ